MDSRNVNGDGNLISDRTKEGFVMVPNSAFKYILQEDGPIAFTLYCALRKYTNRQTGQTYPGHRTLARLCNINKETVGKYLRVLQAHEVIVIDQDHSVNVTDHYYINDPVDWVYGKPDSEASVSGLAVHGIAVHGLTGQNHINDNNQINISNHETESDDSDVKEEKTKEDQAHDEVQRGPGGRKINPKFELYKVYCECRGEDWNSPVGRDIALKAFSDDFVAAIQPHEVKKLYDYVVRSWDRVASKKGEANTTKPTVIHLRKAYNEWKAWEDNRTKSESTVKVVTVEPERDHARITTKLEMMQKMIEENQRRAKESWKP